MPTDESGILNEVHKQLYRIFGLEKDNLNEHMIKRYSIAILRRAGDANRQVLLDGLKGVKDNGGVRGLALVVELAQDFSCDMQGLSLPSPQLSEDESNS